MHPCRQKRGDARQSLRHHLPVTVYIAARLETDGDHRQSLNRAGAQGGNASHAVNRIFDGLGDEDLDLFRRQARGLGLDGYLRRSELGEDLIVGLFQRIEPVGQ